MFIQINNCIKSLDASRPLVHTLEVLSICYLFSRKELKLELKDPGTELERNLAFHFYSGTERNEALEKKVEFGTDGTSSNSSKALFANHQMMKLQKTQRKLDLHWKELLIKKLKLHCQLELLIN